MLPDQSRVTLYDPLTARQLDERFDRIPVFQPRYQFEGGTYAIPNTSVNTNIGTAITFLKEESWTAVEITVNLPGVYNSAGTVGVFNVYYSLDGGTATVITRHDWNIAALQRHLVAGFAVNTAVTAGSHTIQIVGQANTAVQVDFTRSTRILEVLPATY